MRSTVLSTRTKTPERKLQQGQAIVLVALLILVLFAMLGLAIDSGRAYVDRRDQQAAVDAAALAAGDWYLNYFDIATYAIPKSVKLYETDLHLYTSVSPIHSFRLVGASSSLTEDTYVYNYPSGYQLTVVATNTQFNGYQFLYSSTHSFPLAFLQIFGGPTNVTIAATATGIVGNQRQQPAILTLSTGTCAADRPRRHLFERDRLRRPRPERGGKLLRSGRVHVQHRLLLVLQLQPRFHPLRPGHQRRRVPGR
jgi:hypothetical protein